MIEVHLRSDPFRPGVYIISETHSLSPRMARLNMPSRSTTWRPPTDLYETEEAVCVRIEIAGMLEENFSIALSERTLMVRGTRLDTTERRAYHQMEIFFGDFFCELELPCPVIADQVTAEYHTGFLRLNMPKERPTKIQIEE